MSAHLHPGVYIEEVPSSSRTVEGVSTSTAIFPGEAERGPLTPTRVSSYDAFVRLYGSSVAPDGSTRLLLPLAVQAFFANGGGDCYILRLSTNATTAATSALPVEASSPGQWGNSLQVSLSASSDGDPDRRALTVSYRPPGSAAHEVVENWDRLSLNATDELFAGRILGRSAYIRWNGTLAAWPTGTHSLTGATADAAPAPWSAGVLAPLDAIDDAALLVPASAAALTSDAAVTAAWNICQSYVESRPLQDLFCIADLPRSQSGTTDAAVTATLTAFSTLPTSTRLAAYWPFVQISDPVVRGATLTIPSAGFVAGVYARTDARRGVWKAPAGVDGQVLGAIGLDAKLLDKHQDLLNPRGINALRQLPGAGTVVWGARTTRPSSEWRYVPVRRTSIFLGQSILNSIQWAVFEPNAEPLWQALKVSVETFMNGLYRQGAFAGATPSDSYFVRCDATTTTEADRLAGVVNVLVAFAPLRPAEFVVVKLSQKTAVNA